MAELFPEDPKLSHFSARFSTDKFDPIAARIIVSPAAQLMPKMPIMSSIEPQQPGRDLNSPAATYLQPQHSPRPQYLGSTNSPKRPLPLDDFEDAGPPRKAHRGDQQDFVRGVSPLKGAAGRRLDQQRRGGASHTTATVTIPRDVSFLLGIIPPAHTYNAQRFNSSGMVRLLQDTTIPDYSTWRNNKDQGQRSEQPPSHARQVSSDYPPQFAFQNRDSPHPQGRSNSPYPGDGSGRVRLAPATATYRPGSSSSYEPPAAAYGQGQQAPYHQGAPPAQGQYDNSAAPSWPPYNAGTPTVPPPTYSTPSAYGQQPPQQQPPAQYGHYQY